MALYGDPSFDSRVQREATTLATEGYAVTIACLEVSDPSAMDLPAEVRLMSHRPALSDVLPGTRSPFHPDDPGTARPTRNGRFAWLSGYVRNARSWGRWAAASVQPDAWHAHDLTALAALGRTKAFRRPVVYDSHELYLESGSSMRLPAPVRWALRRYERRLARNCATVITVNRGVADALRERYGVDPVVVLNCPSYEEVRRPGEMRDRLRLGDRPILLYHGALSPGRGIGATIAALRALPPDVAFVVLGNGSLGPELLELQSDSDLTGRLVVHPAVPPRDLLRWVVDADVAVVLIEATELNFRLSTPNKLFEAMTSGVPVLASPLPVMSEIINAEQIGWTVDPTDAAAVAARIGEMLGQPNLLRKMGERARRAARDRYNWERQAEGLLATYERVLGGSARPRR